MKYHFVISIEHQLSRSSTVHKTVDGTIVHEHPVTEQDLFLEAWKLGTNELIKSQNLPALSYLDTVVLFYRAVPELPLPERKDEK